MKKISDILQSIKEKSGNDQLSELKKHKNNEVLKEILYYTYNPHLVYGIKETSFNKIYKQVRSKPSPYYNLDENWEVVKEILDQFSKQKGVKDQDVLNYCKIVDRFIMSDRKTISEILFKDLKLGLGSKTINKVWEDLIPSTTFGNFKFDVQRLNNYEKNGKTIINKRPFQLTWCDRKYDGENCNVLELDCLKLVGRSGKELPRLKKIKEQCKNLNTMEYLYSGEITWLDWSTGIDECNNSTKEEFDDDLVLILFDKIYKEDFLAQEKPEEVYKRKVSLWNEMVSEEERKRVDSLNPEDDDFWFYKTFYPNIFVARSICISSDEEYQKLCQIVYNKKWEGLVLRDPYTNYSYGEKGKKEKIIYRFKPRYDDEFQIVDFIEGTGKCEGTLGSIVIKMNSGDIVNVGSGYKDNERDFIWNNKDKILVSGLELKVEYQRVSPTTDPKTGKKKYSLRHPSFKGFRDKEKNDINIFKI